MQPNLVCNDRDLKKNLWRGDLDEAAIGDDYDKAIMGDYYFKVIDGYNC